MVKIPLETGVKGDSFRLKADLAVNMMPRAVADGVSNGASFSPCPGAVATDMTPGVCRGVFMWRDAEYRIFGSWFGRVSRGGKFVKIAEIDDARTPVGMAGGFDRMAVVSAGKAYYYDTARGLYQITAENLGGVTDVVWSSGYFLFTDGTNIIAADLADPTKIESFSYGSSEASPDPVEQLLTLRGEVVAVNRNTIEFFYPAGQGFFPFARNTGAQINRGGAGPRCAAVFQEGIVFLGSGAGEPLGVYAAAGGQSQKISNTAVDDELSRLTEAQAALSLVEPLGQMLFVHTEIGTLVYDAEASVLSGMPCWHIRTTTNATYSPRYFCTRDHVTHVADRDGGLLGILSDDDLRHFGKKTKRQTSTMFAFYDTNRAIINELQLQICDEISIGQGRIVMQYSEDGKVWSHGIPVAPVGRDCVIWRGLGRMNRRKAFRFIMESDYACTILRADLQVEVTL